MNLYEIDEEIMNCVDEETGELFDVEKFHSLRLEREAKIENVCLWIKNLKAAAEALKAEKNALAERQKATENRMESLKKFMAEYLNGTKFETAKVKVSFRKSESLEISENAVIPEEFLKHREPDIDKVGMKEAMKNGQTFEGVSLAVKNNIQIK